MKNESAGLFAVVLAAGKSNRFGSSKQLAEFEGQTLLQRSLDGAEGVCDNKTVTVLGANWRQVAKSCEPLRGFLTYNARYERGIGESIACGTRAVAESASAILILLADQPLVTAAHLTDLINRWHDSPTSIVASEFAGTTGPPIIFPAGYFDELLALTGDSGAKSVTAKHRGHLVTVSCEACAYDVDKPQDLERLTLAGAETGVD